MRTALLAAGTAVVLASEAAGAALDFGGRSWNLRETPGDPGNNQWSTNCVWKDAAGRLHLQVRELGGQWYCGEAESGQSANYGEYRWYAASRFDTLDPNVVAGLFTYGPPWGSNEIDFEFTYGFDPVTNNLHYTVHPWYLPGHTFKSRVDASSPDTTHSFVWEPGRIRWRSWYGHSAAPSNAADVIEDWTYDAPGVPADSHEHIYLNCWLANHTIAVINESNTFQALEGFGASLTDSSAYLLEHGLTGAERTNLLRALFSPADGIGLNLLRQPIGASDFRLFDYTYDDLPAGQTDYGLTNFSIAHDEDCIIPLLKTIRGIQPDLHLFAAPWSAPAWMKDSGSLYWGSLRADAYDAYAGYLRRFAQAYAAHGLPIETMTLQNEPLYEPYTYPGMEMSAADQARFARLVAGEFQAHGIVTRIVCYDHNWDEPGYPLSVFADTGAAAVVSGSAFHAYAGDVSAQSTVHAARPDKDIYFTEATCVNWYSNFADNLLWDARQLLVGALTHWSRTVIKWNLALDPAGGPKRAGGCDGCTGIITVNTNSRTITTNADFYALGHASKFIRRGARRIASTETQGAGPYTVAFQNPDSNLVLLAYNPLDATRLLTLRWRQEKADYALPGRSLATFTWPCRAGATAEVWLTTGDRRCLLQKQTNGPAFRPPTASWTARPSAEIVLAGFSFTPLAGTNVYDEFDDGVIDSAWHIGGAGGAAENTESGGALVLHPTDQNWFSAIHYYRNEIEWPRDGYETVFSASLRTVLVTRANSGGWPVDLWATLCLLNDNGVCDPWWASNTITLRGGYDSAADSLQVELYTKTATRMNNGTLRFQGRIDNVRSYSNTNGLEFQIALRGSSYTARVLYEGAGVPLVTNSGSTTGPHNLGGNLNAGHFCLIGGNENDGRGYVSWERARVIVKPDATVTGSAPSAGTVWVGMNSTAVFRVDARTNGLAFNWSMDGAACRLDGGAASVFEFPTSPEFLGPHAVGVTVYSGPNLVFSRQWSVLVGDGDPLQILRWPFDNDGRDYSGWGNEIPIGNDGAIGWDGVSGRALELNSP